MNIFVIFDLVRMRSIFIFIFVIKMEICSLIYQFNIIFNFIEEFKFRWN
jgi:hypothetical protein